MDGSVTIGHVAAMDLGDLPQQPRNIRVPDAAALALQVVIGKNVAAGRRALGITQRAMAKQLGTSQRHLWAIENGQANITVQAISELAAALNTTPEALLIPPPTTTKRR
jgi:DNA-binding XRE family transcriptional regulator